MRSVIGIDLGTQSLKVVVYDYAARAVAAIASAALDLYRDDGGAAEQRAEAWLQALHRAFDAIDPAVLRTAAAVGVSGQQHGFVALDRAGRVLAPVKLWCDTSTVAECAEITDAFGGAAACLERAGNLVLPGYTASKIRWLKKQRPDLYEKLDCILLPHDYLNLHLAGERCMEAGDASGTGFLDVRARAWSRRMLAAIDPERDLEGCLPPLRIEPAMIGRVTGEAARLTGLPAGIPVASGGGDNMMGAIGTGNVSPGRLTMSLGTSGTVYACSDRPVVDPRGEIAAFCSSTGGWLPLMCTMNCTVTTEVMRRLLDAGLNEFEARVAAVPPGAGGVLTLPFFGGERTPNLPRGKACVLGLDDRNTRPENLLRSALEGATFALRYGVDRLRVLGVEAEEIVLTGGGAGSATWRQVVADVCDRPVTVLEQDEGASLGAALQALAVLEDAHGGELATLVQGHLSPDAAACSEPRPEVAEFYDDAYAAYLEAVDAISPLYLNE